MQAYSSNNVCLLCASRLGLEVPPPATRCTPFDQRRRITSSRNNSQSWGTAAAQQKDDAVSDGSSRDAGGWGARPPAKTTLSEDELRARQALMGASDQTSQQSTNGNVESRFRINRDARPPPRQAFQSSPRANAADEEESRFALLSRAGGRSSQASQHEKPTQDNPFSRRSSGIPSERGISGLQQGRNGEQHRKFVLAERPALRIQYSDNRPSNPNHIGSFDPSVSTQWSHLKRREQQSREPIPDMRASPIVRSVQSNSSSNPVPREDTPFRRETDAFRREVNPFRREDDAFRREQSVRQRQARDGAFVPLSRGRPEQRCFRCGSLDHRISDCPQPSGAPRRKPAATDGVRERRFGLNQGSEYGSREGTRQPSNEDILRSSQTLTRTERKPEPVFESQPAVVDERSEKREDRRRARFELDEELAEEKRPSRKNARDSDRRSGRFDVEQDFDDEEEYERNRRKAQRKQEKAEKEKARRRAAVAAAQGPTPIHLPAYISVTNLATALRVRLEDFVKKLNRLGFEDVQGDHVLNAEDSGLIAMEYNHEPIIDRSDEVDLKPQPLPENMSSLPSRPPVVTIMGHVDHGKTTILDYLRKSSVAAQEHGGITQHIGAFSVPVSSGDKTITFLDTPGHAAFLSMRQRGANVTDIVILVVAADDSVKPQTLESIKCAQQAGVPTIVAINKIDKEGADPQRVRQDLARYGVEVEDLGGDIQAIECSGKTGKGLDKLEEAIVLQSEILDHRAPVDGPVEGWILEATTKKSGRVATILVKRGTLRAGDILVAGSSWSRVRSLRNEAGSIVSSIGPGLPVEVDGWKGQAEAGDQVLQAENEQRATEVVEYRETQGEKERMAKDMEAIGEARRLQQEKRERELAEAAKAKEAAKAIRAGTELPSEEKEDAEPLVEEKAAPGMQLVPLILKADVSGSVEAVEMAISSLGNNEVRPQILRAGVGAVSEFDVEHAAAAEGHVVTFNTTAIPEARQLAEQRGVKILENNIIYRLVDDVKALLSEKLPLLVKQSVRGEAEVAMVFEIGVGGRKKMKIAGLKVRNGSVSRGSKVRVNRNGREVYNGKSSYSVEIRLVWS